MQTWTDVISENYILDNSVFTSSSQHEHSNWHLNRLKEKAQLTVFNTLRINISFLCALNFSMRSRGGRIDPNIDSIDSNVCIGIGSILAW